MSQTIDSGVTENNYNAPSLLLHFVLRSLMQVDQSEIDVLWTMHNSPVSSIDSPLARNDMECGVGYEFW